jgi:hypothetical protein
MIVSTGEPMSTRTELLSIREKPNAEIACDLTGAPDTLDERFAEYGRLFQHALARRQRAAAAVEFEFAAKPGVAEWVADLARREATCCPFLAHHVSSDAAHVLWRISSETAGPEAQFTLDEYHDLPERYRDGLQGHLERAAARGLTAEIRGARGVELDDGNRKAGILDKLKAACGC